MKSSHWFVLATAVAGSAVACGFYLLRQPTASSVAGVGAVQEPSSVSSRRSLSASEGRRGLEHRKQASQNRRSTAESVATREPEPRRIVKSQEATGAPVVSETQWLARAAKVEQEANHELNRLSGLLELDSLQQDQLFALLAKRSAAWLPGMQTSRDTLGGTMTPVDSAVSTEADDVMAYLSADQQQTLIQDEMDRQAWWEEVLPQLLPPQLSDGTVDGTTPISDDSGPETKPFEGGEMLLEE